MMTRRNIGLSIVFLWIFIGGIAHLVFTEAEMRIVPPYIPWPRAPEFDTKPRKPLIQSTTPGKAGGL